MHDLRRARLDATCEASHPYRTLIGQKQLEFTQQLVDDNLEALDQWLASAEKFLNDPNRLVTPSV